MRLAISNIAWDRSEDEAMAGLLQRHRIDAIDIAPGKYFPAPVDASLAQIAQVRGWWADQGITLTGMQALLFGTSGLNVFGDAAVRRALRDHLAAVMRIAGALGATRLAFGSPRNRDRSGLDDAQTEAIAVPFFRELGDIAAAHGVLLCLEPNPPRYGANYMTTHAETVAVLQAVDHPAVRLQLDTGALSDRAEPVEALLQAHAAWVGHVHASEPGLVPLGDGATDHAAAATALRRHLPQLSVTIEMVATADEPHLQAIERAVSAASRHYRDADTAATSGTAA